MKSKGAYYEGVDARLEGKDKDSCEYSEGTEEREDWETGYVKVKMAEEGVEGFFAG